ncbi:hypothetical protein EFK50_01055 [Nocardioides marmoriginsengisoli]|uniref:Uncharacterized protein n=1 Tax=Nocardioides marmoriginsengisoli TaxID=661483 RepID=A0A3N0CS25_9ACTN|nr:DUF6093 family protein [Nocardioides marmoriginsengisoli]RNL66245.1 hypothetical protein EFK50_01055 [Nocardioides marmoriginsengisoli]
MFTAAELAEHQADAESLMTLCLTLFRPTGTFTQDPDGYEVPDYEDMGQVRGKIQSGSAQGRDTATRYLRIGDVERPVLEAGLHVPISAAIPKPGRQRGHGWEYEVTSVGCADDPALLGRRYLVVEVPAKSFATARRLDVVEVTD